MNPLIAVVRDAVRVSLDLFKVMVPIIILVKVLQTLGAVDYLAAPVEPLMELVGLPAGLGLAWATAMLSSIYSGLVVFYALAPSMGPLSQAQVTVLGVLMLIAHNLLVEGQVTRRCGLSFFGQNLLRVFGALGCAWILHFILEAGGYLAQPAHILLAPQPQDASLVGWAFGELKNLGWIFLVILALMALMRVLNAVGATRLFEAVLEPFLRLMGIGRKAATVTVIGMTMGLAYGGGLIIHEAQSGKLSRRDIFASVSLMSLSHALIEDTLLLTLIGASPWGTMVARLSFSLVVIAVLARVVPIREDAAPVAEKG
ncbi:nucleoside recognition domain-containing protein [Fundidesulfovibrio soli]|uniref:nucleoside recognition domain-containing protein n=1 Tax=Fundidesulfovibrio soli TaxID=2922716 RepID=UPI001FB0461D|nr:nucleoside recognition domain-containing protein [Fundidesulfovibrio soli]